jgi:aminopeptidase N
MLNTLRQVINDDEKWRSLLRGLNRDFYHKVVKGSQIETYLADNTGMNLGPFFDQYLRDVRIPVLEYAVKGKTLTYRWANCVAGFDIPVKVNISGQEMVLNPATEFRSVSIRVKKPVVTVDPNWYVTAREIK